jgi:hypothetical protein
MIFIDYQKKLTPGGAEPKRALRSSSLTGSFRVILLILFEAAVIFRSSFATALCLKKA